MIRKVPHINNKRGRSAHRFSAYAALICFIMIAILSNVYIFLHAEHSHEHDHEYGITDDCMVCVYAHNAKELLRQFGAGIRNSPFLVACMLSALAALSAIFASSGYQTLVKLKTRMND